VIEQLAFKGRVMGRQRAHSTGPDRFNIGAVSSGDGAKDRRYACLPSNRCKDITRQWGDAADRKSMCPTSRPLRAKNRSACAHAMRLFDRYSPLGASAEHRPRGDQAKDTVTSPTENAQTMAPQRACPSSGKTAQAIKNRA